MGWMFAALMMLFWLLILVALAVGVYWLFTRLFGNDSATESAHDPRAEGSTKRTVDVLDERYARGEIDDEEYARRKRRLNE